MIRKFLIFFMRMHKKNCITGEYRGLISVFDTVDVPFERVVSPICAFFKDVYRFPWDLKLSAVIDIMLVQETALNSNLLSKQTVLVSSLACIPHKFYSVINRLVVIERIEGGFSLQFRGKCEDYYDIVNFSRVNMDVRTSLMKCSSRSVDGYNPLKTRRGKYDKKKVNILQAPSRYRARDNKK